MKDSSEISRLVEKFCQSSREEYRAYLYFQSFPKSHEDFEQRFPISYKIERLFWGIRKTKSVEKITEIFALIDCLEQRYKKAIKDRGGTEDRVTIEVFPGARSFYKSLLETKTALDLASATSDHYHYIDDFKMLENSLP